MSALIVMMRPNMMRVLRALGLSACALVALGAGVPVDGVFGSGRGCEMYSMWGMETVTTGIPTFDPGSPAGEELLKKLYDENDRAMERLESDPNFDGSSDLPLLLGENGVFSPGMNCRPIAVEGDRVTFKCWDVMNNADTENGAITPSRDKVLLTYDDGTSILFTQCSP